MASAAADRAALVALFHATGGTSWKRSDNWGTDAHLSKWYGVKVSDQGRVVKLDLNRNNLQGALPKALGSLRKLKQLYLYHNQLTGVIPKEFGALNKLQKLYLHTNELIGTIPEQLGDLVNLKELLLHSNSLEGRIPKALGTLTELQGLNLGNNSLSGPLPKELGALRKLRALRLKGNELSGAIPPSLGDLETLQILALEDNELTGGPADRESLDAWRARLRRHQQAAKRGGVSNVDVDVEKPKKPSTSSSSSSPSPGRTPPPRHVEPTATSPAPPSQASSSPEDAAARRRSGEDSAARRYELALSSVIGGKVGGSSGGGSYAGTTVSTSSSSSSSKALFAKGGDSKTPPKSKPSYYASYDESSDGEQEKQQQQQQQQQQPIQTRQLRTGRVAAARAALLASSSSSSSSSLSTRASSSTRASLSSSSSLSRLRGSSTASKASSSSSSLAPDVGPAVTTTRAVTPRASHKPPGLASATLVEEEDEHEHEQESVYRDLIPPSTPPPAKSEPPPPSFTPPAPAPAPAALSSHRVAEAATAAAPEVDEDETLRAKIAPLPGLDKLTRENHEALQGVKRLVEAAAPGGGSGSGAGDDGAAGKKLRELERLVALANDLDGMVSRDAGDQESRQKELALAPGPAAYSTAVRTGLCRAYLASSVVGSSLVSASETGGMGKAGRALTLMPGVPLVGGLAGFAAAAVEAGDRYTETRRVEKVARMVPGAAECCSLARRVALRLADGLAAEDISAAGGSSSSPSRLPSDTGEEAAMDWFVEEVVASSGTEDSGARGASAEVQGGKKLGRRHLRTLLKAVGRDCLEGKSGTDEKVERLASEILPKAETPPAPAPSPPKETAAQSAATPAPAHGGGAPQLEPTGELAAMRARLEALEAAKEKQEEELKALRLENERRQAEYEAWKVDKDKLKRWLASIDKRLPRSSSHSSSSRSIEAADPGARPVSQERRAKTKEDFWQNSDAGKKKGFLGRLRDR